MTLSLTSMVYMHAGFDTDATKSFVKRWRPQPYSNTIGFLPHQGRSIDLFCKAVLFVNEDCGCVAQFENDDVNIHLFLIRKNRLKMCMWAKDMSSCAKTHAFGSLNDWFTDTHPDTVLFSDLIDSDAVAWKEMKQ